MCICTPTYKAHAPYYTWPVWLYSIFPHHLKTAQFSERKKVTEYKMCVLFFSTTFIWNFHSKNWARYNHKCILVFRQSTRYSCRILIKLEFSIQIFEKYSNIKLHENPSSGSRHGPCGQADRHNEAISRFSRFYERGKNRGCISSYTWNPGTLDEQQYHDLPHELCPLPHVRLHLIHMTFRALAAWRYPGGLLPLYCNLLLFFCVCSAFTH